MRFVMAGLTGLLICGCGTGAPPPPELPDLVTVSGQVTLDGKPLEGAVVIFTPKTDGGFGALGGTNAEGHYELETRHGETAEKGAAAGEYEVRVTRFLKLDGTPLPADPSEPPAMSGAMESLQPRYSSPTEGTLKATVGPTGGTIDFELESN